jgi:hypothetical protein
MSTRNYTLLENASTGSLSYQYSEKGKASGYHSIPEATHTAVYSVDNFNGIISLQGSLAEYPGDTDWVNIDGTEYDSTDSTTTPSAVSFKGNFVWIRAKYLLNNGIIIKIQYNF